MDIKKKDICLLCPDRISGKFYFDKWGNKIHSYHTEKEFFACNSCERLVKFKDKNNLSMLCDYCNNSIVSTQIQAQLSYNYIKSVFEKVEIFGFPQKVNIRFNTNSELKQLLNNSSITPIGIMSTTTQKSSIGSFQKYEIHIAKYLPKVEFDATLAHEMLHIWLIKQGYKLSHDITEGFCNLGCYLILNDNKTLHGDILLDRMEINPDPSYGIAYRKLKKDLLRIGWKRFLSSFYIHISQKNSI